jgi:hypothetical protein
MNSDKPVAVRKRQSRCNEGTPIATLGAEALVAKNVAHQAGEAVRNFFHAKARLVRRNQNRLANTQ